MRVLSLPCILLFLTQQTTAQFIPPDKALYDTIVKSDSMFFAAYNSCDKNLDVYASFYAEDLEFLHDQGGYSNSKADMVEATRKNVCGKVTRTLVPGSVEVYPIANYGAVEIGYHIFRNKENPPGTVAQPGRFVIVWRKESDRWLIARVISLH